MVEIYCKENSRLFKMHLSNYLPTQIHLTLIVFFSLPDDVAVRLWVSGEGDEDAVMLRPVHVA